MRLRDKIDAWYERHSDLTALIVLAVIVTVLARVPEVWRHVALNGAAFAFIGMLTKGLTRALK